MSELFLTGARPYGGSEPLDVAVRGGVVAEIGPAGSLRPGAAEVVDLDGRYLGPGMWDWHVHLRQVVLRSRRIDLTRTASAASILTTLGEALAALPPGDGLVAGYGFRDALWPDPPRRAALDAVAGDRPVVLISADLHCGWFSSAAARLTGVLPDDAGMLREGPWMAVLRDIEAATELTPAMYAEVTEAAARRGVVGVIEFENADNVGEWPARIAAGADQLRVRASIWPDRLDDAVARGLRTGDPLGDAGLVTVGPLKVILDGSLNTRTALCLDPYPGSGSHGETNVTAAELRRLLALASRHGIEAAVHAIGDRSNRDALDAFEELGIRGAAIEHAQLVAAEDFPRFGRLGVIAGVQPEHAMDDRDSADVHWAGRTGRSFAYRSLLEGGARLRLGSDAPVATFDPWVTLAAATTRSRDGRPGWHPEQRIPVDVALAASVDSALDVGERADLVVVEADPLTAGEDVLRAMPVAGTLLGGHWTWRAWDRRD